MTPVSGRRRVSAAVIIAAGTMATSAFVLGPGDARSPHPPGPADTVAAVPNVTVIKGDVAEIVTLPATIAALPHFSVTADTAGRLRRTGLTSGSRVSEGQSLFSVGGATASSPVVGIFTQWLVADGADVAAGTPVAELTYPGFAEVAAIPPEAAYRVLSGALTARANITSGPGPFDCPILQAPAGRSTDPSPDPSGAAPGAVVMCAIPIPVKAFAGLSGTVAVRSRQAGGVLILPVASVAGSAQHGEVFVVGTDGARHLREVDLGLTNGSVVQITGGLNEGDHVTATAPPLTARLP